MNEELENKIIAYAYDDLNSFEKIEMKRLIGESDEARKIFDEHRSVYNSVKNVNRYECPDELVKSVNQKIGLREDNNRSFFGELYTLFISKPALAAATASVLVLIFVSTLFINRPVQYNGYSKMEVELADRQVKYSLAVIGKIFDKTEETIEKEVLATKVGKPIKQGINLVNNLFIKEKENETSN